MSEPTSPTPNSTSLSETVPPASADLPLAEVTGGLAAQPDAISELFAREPDSWNEADMVRMVAELRKRRVELDAAPEKKPRAAKKPAVKIDAKDGLDLLAKLSIKL